MDGLNGRVRRNRLPRSPPSLTMAVGAVERAAAGAQRRLRLRDDVNRGIEIVDMDPSCIVTCDHEPIPGDDDERSDPVPVGEGL